jgi:phosphoribosylglycinamide formyltransferase 2
MTDTDELVAVIRRVQPDFVVTATEAVSPDALAAVEARVAPEASAEHGFPELVPSARSVRLTSDREGLRRFAADELGLPTAPFWFAGSLDELHAVAAHAGFPLLVKPVTGAAGRGHSVVAGPDDVLLAWQHAVGSGGRVLAERVVEVEVHVTLIVVRSAGPQGPAIEFCTAIGRRGAAADGLESWQPQPLSTPALDAAKSIAARVVKALGGRGVFSVELMINGDEVYFSDVAAWPHDSAWVTLRSQRLSAFELQARAILGLPVDTMMISPGAARVLNPGDQTGRAGSERIRGAPTGDALAEAAGVPESDVRVFGRGRGVALATAPDVAAARDRARQVAAALFGHRQH